MDSVNENNRFTFLLNVQETRPHGFNLYKSRRQTKARRSPFYTHRLSLNIFSASWLSNSQKNFGSIHRMRLIYSTLLGCELQTENYILCTLYERSELDTGGYNRSVFEIPATYYCVQQNSKYDPAHTLSEQTVQHYRSNRARYFVN